MTTHYRVIIVGSGPAGLTAALYCARANLKPLCIEGGDELIPPGGQLMITTDVENYPGFPTGILGPQLIEEFRKQAERFNTRFISGDVTKVELQRQPFRLTVNDEATYESRTLIISTGASAKLLGLESESKLMGHGVSACATCDGFFFKGKEVLVVGGGDTAMEEATFLTKFATKVTIIHRRDKLRASKIMQDRAMKNPKIGFIWDSVVTEVLGVNEGHVTGVRIKNLKSGQTSDLPCGGLFIAIGHEPNTKLFVGQLEMDAHGYLKTQPGSTATNIPGVFASGDAQDHVYRQAVTAAGTGCMAAIDAERYLESLKG